MAQVNEWLKFAEAKNGALVVLNSAVVALSIPPAIASHPWTDLAQLWLWTSWLLLAAGLLIALLSFLPATQIPFLDPAQPTSPNDNLIFFGHARNYDVEEYLHALRERTGAPHDSGWERDVAGQIITNAKIASWKYSCFKGALWCTIAAIVTPVLAGLTFGGISIWRRVHGLDS